LNLSGSIEIDLPNDNIYKVDGIANINNNQIHFDINNILLRGAVLKNVDCIYGIAIYTGIDTKFMKNVK